MDAASVSLVCCTILILQADPARAQTRFGARDLLAEQLSRHTWERHRTVVPMVGLSLIGPQWRAAGGFRLDWSNHPAALRLTGRWRLGPLGGYASDLDEWYDLLRLITFARVDNNAVYVRVGPLRDMRLGGIGHMVNHYSTQAAWDARTVGAEMSLTRGPFTMDAFTGDLLLREVSGGRLRLRLPRRTAVSVGYALDTRRDLRGWNAEMQSDLFASGALVFAPFVSYARYLHHGESLAFGGDLRADEFIDLFSASLRLGTFYNSERFIPGYFGALYSVQNPQARIVKSGADLNRLTDADMAGVPLRAAHTSHELFTELNLLIGRSFRLRYYWRRHYGAQPLSELHLRLFLRTGQFLELGLGMDQLGKRGFWSLFHALEDQSALAFESTFRLIGVLMIHTEARYSFELLPDKNVPRYLIQRRFEPLVALRIDF